MAGEATTRRIIELDVRTSSEALRAIKAQAESMKKLETAAGSAKDSLKQFAIGFAAAFSVSAVISGFKGAIDAMDALNDKSGQLGISAENLQEWNHAATMSGASAEDMEKGIIGLSKSMAGMDNATDKSTKALKAFGVTATDSVDAALTKIAEGFSKLEDGPRKTALAMDIFSKSGAKLIPTLNEGAEGIAKLKKEAHDLGLVISDSAVQAAARLNDDLDRLSKTAAAVGMQITEGLLPALQTIATTLTDSMKAGDGFAFVGKKLGDALINLTALAIATGAAFEGLGLIGAAMWEAISHPLTPFAPVFEKLDADMAKLEKRTNDRLRKMRDNLIDSQNAAIEIARASAAGIDALIGKPKGTVDTGNKTDNDIKALEKYIEAAQKVGVAERELTQVQALAVLVQKEKIQVTSAAEKALYQQAEAAAKLADLRKRQFAEEKADVAAGEKRNQELLAYIERIKGMRTSMIEAADPVAAIVRQMAELDEVIANTTDPAQIQALERFGAVLEKALGRATGAGVSFVDTFTTVFEDLGTAVGRQVQGWATDVTDAIVEMAETGKLNVKGMVNSMLADMARLLVQRQLQKGFDAAATGIAKWINSAQGNVFGPTGVQAFASGGVVSSPTVFGMAGGGVGLMGEAGPEAIMPLKRSASGDLGVGASPVNVTVINNNGSQIKTEETRSAGGGRDIRVMVDSAVEEALGRGRFDRVMATSYGVARKGR
jgi:hypothetical protein